jgi:hypothetical protein
MDKTGNTVPVILKMSGTISRHLLKKTKPSVGVLN